MASFQGPLRSTFGSWCCSIEKKCLFCMSRLMFSSSFGLSWLSYSIQNQKASPHWKKGLDWHGKSLLLKLIVLFSMRPNFEDIHVVGELHHRFTCWLLIRLRFAVCNHADFLMAFAIHKSFMSILTTAGSNEHTYLVRYLAVLHRRPKSYYLSAGNSSRYSWMKEWIV